MDMPTPDGRVDILLFKDEYQLVSYYFSEIETWKVPRQTLDRTLKIIFKDRVVSYPVENIKCWTLYGNSKKYQDELQIWLLWQHDHGHPDTHPFGECKYCRQSQEALVALREKLRGDN